MNPNELVVSITLVAVALADILTEEELEIASVAFTQLGDTLATISTRKSILSENASNCTSNDSANNASSNKGDNASDDT